MSDSSEATVLKELGNAAGANTGVLDATQSLAEAHAAEVAAAQQASNKTLRQERLASNREKAQARIAADLKAEQDAINEVGAVDVGYDDDGDVTGQIPTDVDGNPLFYFSRKSKRVMRATKQMHRPDMRRKFGLMACQPPPEIRERIAAEQAEIQERRQEQQRRQREAAQAQKDAERAQLRSEIIEELRAAGLVVPASEQASVEPPQASDAARALAEANGLDLSTIPGTGNNGTVTKGDVEKALAAAGDGGQ